LAVYAGRILLKVHAVQAQHAEGAGFE
jgi:hypothetical protein